MRKQINFEDVAGSSPSSNPKTPRRAGKDSDLDGGAFMVGGTAVTPMKRVPILANFEEWMKMATDNKINAANSWNFALIDYFHDMSLLKEGDGVNFQKASCTLDGCVKIYTSRVDSVATETGKLLSGLADSGNSKKKRGENEEGEESEGEAEDEDGVVRKKPKKRVRTISVIIFKCSAFWRWILRTFSAFAVEAISHGYSSLVFARGNCFAAILPYTVVCIVLVFPGSSIAPFDYVGIRSSKRESSLDE
jgi:hypothetical protein